MKKYVRPEMDVVEFENEDVITTSNCSGILQICSVDSSCGSVDNDM